MRKCMSIKSYPNQFSSIIHDLRNINKIAEGKNQTIPFLCAHL